MAAKTVDFYDGFLTDYYTSAGFMIGGRVPFDPQYAHDWIEERDGRPDVIFATVLRAS
jgi:hypothetical protein